MSATPRFATLFALLLATAACNGPAGNVSEKHSATMSASSFDWQGHRGARGLMPENTVPAFLKALEYPAITTLELDLAVSKDHQLIVSHEPWFSAVICNRLDGQPIGAEDEKDHLIYQMTVAELQAYDCGSRGNPNFPEQQKRAAVKPTLAEVVNAVQAYCTERDRPAPRYNIEIKSRPEWDGQKTPPVDTFARLVVEAVQALAIAERSCIQSFDPRALEAVHALDASLTTAYLTEKSRSLAADLRPLSYRPEIYSPYYRMVTANLVKEVHEHDMKIIPWTINDTTTMNMLIDLGVDGIITDYPDRIP